MGFPGETEAEFAELCDFVRAAEFDWLGCFGYSDEEGSAAHALPGKLPARKVESRRRKLMEIQRRISRRKKRAWVGRELQVLLEGPSPETELLWEGRGEMHAPEIDGKLFINDFGPHRPRPGEFYRCEIIEAHDYDLIGQLL